MRRAQCSSEHESCVHHAARHKEDELAVRKHLKVFVGGLPDKVEEREVEQHFAKYGHVVHCNVCPPKDGEKNKAPYAFVSFRFAADADCAVVDRQDFPGVQRQLAMGFATPRKKDNDEEKQKQDAMLSEVDPCKVFVGGIGDRDSEEEVGDFFSQWGLVTLVYRDRASWGFVHFATKEAALRILEESNVVFHRRRLDIKARLAFCHYVLQVSTSLFIIFPFDSPLFEFLSL
ncbi:HRP1 [Symbiodinium pilosum]|uniref:HRP1 protein n=1 Tax=Symbiodinium pilosum TaxID=2952 RepID=A0A812WWJ9_SYMPI|nr:HRP1 [Symbiodinium pilosum]